MFDPFKDFTQRGYLRNTQAERDLDIVREVEHTLFRANLSKALAAVAGRRPLVYDDFLNVHRILFSAFYPWAGQDRAQVAPNSAISKAGTIFAHPQEIQRAVDAGLRIGQDNTAMRRKPGEVMGYFAFAHPFLDGNGRTMLIIHSELCHRADFCIAWERTCKTDYLRALSAEIETPCKGLLDNYLHPFIEAARPRDQWGGTINQLPGLNSRSVDNTVDGAYSDQQVAAQYQAFRHRRRASEGGQ